MKKLELHMVPAEGDLARKNGTSLQPGGHWNDYTYTLSLQPAGHWNDHILQHLLARQSFYGLAEGPRCCLLLAKIGSLQNVALIMAGR